MTESPIPTETVFTWAAPPLKFGLGALDEIGHDVASFGAGSCLVITDPGVRATGVPDRARDIVAAAGIRCEIFDGVTVEPTDVSIAAAAAWARQREWDCYLAVGGGSAIDTAKAVNLLTTHPGELIDYVTPPLGAGRAPDRALKPLIAVPTTAGTGSESTAICVVDLLGLRLKAGVSHPRLRPLLAVVDPLTTVSLPAEVTAACGMDVVCHALESYTAAPFDARPRPPGPASRPAFCGSNPVSDVWAEKALELAGAHLRAAVHRGDDVRARYHMALAATYAGTGFGNAGTHLPHANAYPIAGAVDGYAAPGYPPMPMVPHGQAVSVTAPAAFRWTYPADPGRHLRAAALLSGQEFTQSDGDGALPEVLAGLMRDIGVPGALSEFGYTEADIPTLVDGTMKQTRQLSVVPRPLDHPAATAVFRASL